VVLDGDSIIAGMPQPKTEASWNAWANFISRHSTQADESFHLITDF
jgi:hypothetical protein